MAVIVQVTTLFPNFPFALMDGGSAGCWPIVWRGYRPASQPRAKKHCRCQLRLPHNALHCVPPLIWDGRRGCCLSFAPTAALFLIGSFWCHWNLANECVCLSMG